jgi:hypothetical protein
MEGITNHNDNENYSLSVVNNFHSSLSRTQSSSPLNKIATWRDERLEYLDISTGLIEVLQIHGFTIEMILKYGSTQIAEELGIDDYVAQIIFNETTRAITGFNKSIQKVKE